MSTQPSLVSLMPTTPPLIVDLTLDPSTSNSRLHLPSPSLSPQSSPASEGLSDSELDLEGDHTALLRALLAAPAIAAPSLVETQPGLMPIAPASLRIAPSSTISESSPSTSVSTTSSSLSSASSRKIKGCVSPKDKDAKAHERVLRNRVAAQVARDKKRHYIADIEEANAELQSENARLSKRLKVVEEENSLLASRLDSFTNQLSQVQRQLGLAPANQLLFDGFRDPAVVTNMAGPATAGGAPNDRGNDDQHDGAPLVSKGLASSQQRKPSSQQRIQLGKPALSLASLPRPRPLTSRSRRQRLSTSTCLSSTLPFSTFSILTSTSTLTSTLTSTSTCHTSMSNPKTSWQSVVWMTLSILFWITTARWGLGLQTCPLPTIFSGRESRRPPRFMSRGRFVERILASLSERDLRRLKVTSLRDAARIRSLYRSYLVRIKENRWPP